MYVHTNGILEMFCWDFKSVHVFLPSTRCVSRPTSNWGEITQKCLLRPADSLPAVDVPRPGVEGKQVVVLGHHHHVGLAGLVDDDLAGTADCEVAWRRSPLRPARDDVVNLRGVVAVWRVPRAWGHPHQPRVHLHRRSAGPAWRLSPCRCCTAHPGTACPPPSQTWVCHSRPEQTEAWQ